jgi:uncharacterized protein YaaR (DUF327 family)
MIQTTEAVLRKEAEEITVVIKIAGIMGIIIQMITRLRI